MEVLLVVIMYWAPNLEVSSAFVKGRSLMLFPKRSLVALSSSAKKEMYVTIPLVPNWLSIFALVVGT